jgi:Cu/Ag efflux protein CusF
MSMIRSLTVAAVLALGFTAVVAADGVQGTGMVRAIDARAGTVTIAHEAIRALGWPAMTMPFKVTSATLLERAMVGRKVQFTLVSASDPQISSLNILE